MLRVTSPDVPPPLSPVPAVTAVMSPGFGAIQARPDVVAELAERIHPLVDGAVRATGVDAAEAPMIAPLPVQTALSTKLDVSGATSCQAVPE